MEQALRRETFLKKIKKNAGIKLLLLYLHNKNDKMVYKKLLELQKVCAALKKDKQAYKYNYLSGDKLLSVVRPKMDELGLILLPSIEGVETENIKGEILYKVALKMTWVDTEDGEKLALPWYAAGMNGVDKGFGSALTYGERYYLMKTIHLQTDKDDLDALQRPGLDVPAPSTDEFQKDYKRAVICTARGILSKDGKPAKVWLYGKWGQTVDVDWDGFDADVEAAREKGGESE